MILITSMGSSAFLAAVIIIITFGINFRKGFLLFQLLIWTGLITEIIKTIVAFPRPDFVDNRVFNLESGVKNTSPFRENGSEGVFQFPSKKVLDTFHLQKTLTSSSFGFPSGHVALTTALWGGSSTIFNSKIIKRITPFVVLLVAFSRLYLGRHFLGDLMGGAVIGLILLTIFTLVLKSSMIDEFFKKENFDFIFKSQNIILYFFMFIVPSVLTALSFISFDVAGFFLGTNAAYILIIRNGLPDDSGSIEQRVLRILIALFLFGISSLIIDIGFENIETTAYFGFKYIEFLKTFIPAFTIWITVAICTKFNLYQKEEKFISSQSSEWDRGSLKKSGKIY
jgi:membrane-associated phospholipid phosphatase